MLNDSSISRRHAEVVGTSDGWIVRDLGSMNGTMLNGKRLGRNDQPLRHNDVLQCGDLILGVTLQDPDAPKQPRTDEPLADSNLEKTQPRIKTSGAFVKVQAATQRSWDQALEVVALNRDQDLARGNNS